MIIDFHTHFYPDKIAERALASIAGIMTPAADGTRAGLEQAMTDAGIDLAVGLPLVNSPGNSRGVNEWAIREHGGRIVMLGSVHPEEERPLDTLARIAGAGLPGIKLHPEYQNFRFGDERLNPIWQRCVELDLFVLTHAGGDIKFPPPYRSNPAELAAFHRRHPKLTLILAHFGGMDMWDEVERELIGLPVYFDLAMIGGFNFDPVRLAQLIRRHGADRVLFGTDSPWTNQREAVDFVRKLSLTDDEKERILFRNAARLLRR